MKKIPGIYNLAAFMLILMGLATAQTVEKINRKSFEGASFLERIEMLKLHFEDILITCIDDILQQIVPESEEDEHIKEEMKTISKAISATRHKLNDKHPCDPVLFQCFRHEDKTPSMSWSAKQHGFYCFSCSKNNQVFDLFNCIAMIQGLKGPTTFKESFRVAVCYMVEGGVNIVNPFSDGNYNSSKHNNFIPFSKAMNKIRYYTFYYPIENDSLAISKLEERGISLETAKRHAVMTWYPTSETGVQVGTAYWVFINDNGTYSRRLFAEDKEKTVGLKQKPLKWWNKSATSIGTFNLRVLDHCRQYNEVCFVTESAIDALSIEELGYHAVGLNSISNLGSFMREHIDCQPDILLICLTDNDKAGKEALAHFNKRNLFVPDYLIEGYIGDSWLSRFKDINEALISDRENTLQEVYQLEQSALDFYYKGGK
jgi:hypothetical protein